MRPILQAPAALLRAISRPVVAFDRALEQLAGDMEQAMLAAEGVGLAACQVGEPLRLVVISYLGWRVRMANPVIVSRSSSEQRVDDGCLSVENGARRGLTLRASEIVLEWRDLEGGAHRGRFKGLRAAILQHETDHLDGVLFTDLSPGVKP